MGWMSPVCQRGYQTGSGSSQFCHPGTVLGRRESLDGEAGAASASLTVPVRWGGLRLACCTQAEPSQLRRKDVKLPIITGAAARNAGDADAELDEDAGPSSSAMLPHASHAKPGAAFRAGDGMLRKRPATLLPAMQPSRQRWLHKALISLPAALPCSAVSSVRVLSVCLLLAAHAQSCA